MNQETILAQIMETGRQNNALLIENTGKTERVEAQVMELNRKFDSLAGLPERVARLESAHAADEKQAEEEAKSAAEASEARDKWRMARFGALVTLVTTLVNQFLNYWTTNLHHGK